MIIIQSQINRKDLKMLSRDSKKDLTRLYKKRFSNYMELMKVKNVYSFLSESDNKERAIWARNGYIICLAKIRDFKRGA